MKTQFIAVALCLCLGFSKRAHAQYYIETTKYAQYAPPDSLHSSTQIRYDPIGRKNLVFDSNDSIYIQVWVFDYDPVGNLIKKVTTTLCRNSKIRYRYDVASFHYHVYKYDKNDRLISDSTCAFKPEMIEETAQKIANRLDQK